MGLFFSTFFGAPGRESRHTHLISLLASLHDKVLALGRLSEVELAQNKQALLQHLADFDTLVIDSLRSSEESRANRECRRAAASAGGQSTRSQARSFSSALAWAMPFSLQIDMLLAADDELNAGLL